MIPLDSNGLSTIGTSTANLLNGTGTWVFYQQSTGSTTEVPLYAVNSAEPNAIYRITTIATQIYKNTSLDFYNYPVSVGRYHLMVIMPGYCYQAPASANYDYAHATYVNLETLTVDYCNMEIPRYTSTSDATVACGNGILDGSEACDDGNTRSGDGCSSACLIEAGWLCFSAPFQTKSKFKINIL